MKANLSIESVLDERVDRSGGPDACWEYTGRKLKDGYGQFRVQGTVYRAHRAAWIVGHGSLPDDICVLHKCDNPPCCNPRHLFLGTQLENIRDMVAKKRHRNGGGRWHRGAGRRLTDDQVRELRRLWASGAGYKSLARAFNIHTSTIWLAVTGRTYADVPIEEAPR